MPHQRPHSDRDRRQVDSDLALIGKPPTHRLQSLHKLVDGTEALFHIDFETAIDNRLQLGVFPGGGTHIGERRGALRQHGRQCIGERFPHERWFPDKHFV